MVDDRAIAILVTLIAYKIGLLGLGLWAHRRTVDARDFFLGGRRLGPVVAAVSASASSSSVWTLFGVSGYAYTNGLSALWLFPGCVGGFALNWFLLAPRLRRLAADTGAITVTEVLAGPAGTPLRGAINWTASLIILLSLGTYVAYQFQGAGTTFATTFGVPPVQAVLIGSGIVLAYTLLGGFWAVSLTDTLQGMVMAATAVVLPVWAVVAAGGPTALIDGIAAVEQTGYTNLLGGAGTAAGIGAVAGLLGIGLGYPGQPHVVNRFMALRDERAVVTGRRVALAWAFLVYTGMLVLGLAGRVLVAGLDDAETVFLSLADSLCPPVVAGVVIAAVLSAVMSTADSQLLVAASSASHDLGGGRAHDSPHRSRLVVLGLTAAATAAAILLSASIFQGVLFAWTAMGAAFGPLLLVRCWRGPLRPGATLAAMLAGFGLSVAAYELSLSGFWQRVVPFAVAGAIAMAGTSDRAGHREP